MEIFLKAKLTSKKLSLIPIEKGDKGNMPKNKF
jgi:hypothetical protein